MALAPQQITHDSSPTPTVVEARGYPVKYKKRHVTLGWLVKHKPEWLEYLYSTWQPGTPRFAALAVIYHRYEKLIREVTDMPSAAAIRYRCNSGRNRIDTKRKLIRSSEANQR
jgi:hypothetical protein